MGDKVVIRYRDDTVTLTRGAKSSVETVTRVLPQCDDDSEPETQGLLEGEHGEVPAGAFRTDGDGKDVVVLRRIKLARIVEMVERDDPLNTLCPAEKMLIKGVGDLLRHSPAQLESQYYVIPTSNTVNVYCERDWRHLYFKNITIPEPVILECKHLEAKTLSFGIPSSTTPRPRRGGAVSNASFTPKESPMESAPLGSNTTAVGLRYYDFGSDSYVRIPHGGDVPSEGHNKMPVSPSSSNGTIPPLEKTSSGNTSPETPNFENNGNHSFESVQAQHSGSVKVCIELSPYTSGGGASFGSFAREGSDFFIDPTTPLTKSTAGGAGEGRVGYDTTLPAAVTPMAIPLDIGHVDHTASRAHREEDFLEHLYDESELNPNGAKGGNPKKVVRKGVPTSRKRHFYSQLLCNPTRARRFPTHYDFDTVFEATFKMPYSEVEQKFPSYIPLSPLFGAEEGGLFEKYHHLKKGEVRSIRIVLAMVARRHPFTTQFPAMPRVLCYLVKYLPLRDLHAAAVTLVTQTVGEAESEFKLDASGSQVSSGSGSVKGDDQLKYRLCDSKADVASLVNSLLKAKLAGVSARYQHANINLGALGAYWISTMFSSLLPRYLCERVVDMYILEGVKVFYRMVLAIFKEMQGIPAKSVPCDAGLRDDERLLTSAFAFPLKKKELAAKRSENGTRRHTDTNLQNIVLNRPRLSKKSRILDDPQYLETVYSWIASSRLEGELRRIYDKNEDGKALSSILQKFKSLSNGQFMGTLVMVKAVPRKAGAKRPASFSSLHADEEIFGYFLSDPLSTKPQPYGNASSFGFKLVPQAQKLPSTDAIRHCIFPNSSTLALGIENGTAFLNFDDTDYGTSSPIPLPPICRQKCPKGKCTCKRGKIPAVCGGKFTVIECEVFAFMC